MSCKCCKYKYWVISEWYEYELCPICGHGARFDEFKDGEEDEFSRIREDRTKCL